MMRIWACILLIISLSCALEHQRRYGPNGKMKDFRPTDYGFVAVLYDSRRPNINFTCLGAILTYRWVVDNCMDQGGLYYDRIKTGLARTSDTADYYITQRIQHEDYAKVGFYIRGYDTRNMYAAKNALWLHKTDKTIEMVPYVVRTIQLLKSKGAPLAGYAIFFHNNKLQSNSLDTAPNQYCNDKFASNFGTNQPMLLTKNDLCIDSRGITPELCCLNQPLMVFGETYLGGVMSWSTGCSTTLPIDPWVFTNLWSYRRWIRNITQFN